MMHNTTGLYSLLMDNLAEVNRQIAATKERLEKQIAWEKEVLESDEHTSVYQLQHPDGTFVLAPLLAAKAQVLSGMAALKAADMQQRTSRR